MKLTAALLALACLAPAAAQARPVSAVLYPGTARVTEEAALMPEGGRISLPLPARADADSLRVTLSSGREVGRTLYLRPDLRPSAVSALLQEKETLLAAQDRLSAEIAVVESVRRAWDATAGGASPVACAVEDCASCPPGGTLNAVIAEEVRLRADLRRCKEDLARVETELRELGGQDAMRECVLTLDSAGNAPVTVRWSYWLNESGWRPQYLVQADSASGRIDIRMDAVITQKSGADWEGVDVTLSSDDVLYSVAPPSLRDWTIGGEREAVLRNMTVAAAPRAFKDASLSASATHEASALTWKLGRVDVPASASASRFVGEHAAQASLRRLVRPSVSRQAWIEAELAEPAAFALPSGQASFSVDGAETARGAFSLAPGMRALPFGADRLISVETATLPASAPAPAKGMKALHWGQSVTLTSGHDRPVAVRVEEAAPIAKDSRIRVDVQASPAPELEQDGSRYAWTLELPARESRTLRWSVTATAPEDVPAASSR